MNEPSSCGAGTGGCGCGFAGSGAGLAATFAALSFALGSFSLVMVEIPMLDPRLGREWFRETETERQRQRDRDRDRGTETETDRDERFGPKDGNKVISTYMSSGRPSAEVSTFLGFGIVSRNP